MWRCGEARNMISLAVYAAKVERRRLLGPWRPTISTIKYLHAHEEPASSGRRQDSTRRQNPPRSLVRLENDEAASSSLAP